MLLKKTLASVLAATMLLSLGVIANADDVSSPADESIICGEIYPTPEEEAAYQASLTAEEKQKIQEKEAAAEALAEEVAKRPMPRAIIGLPGTFTVFTAI